MGKLGIGSEDIEEDATIGSPTFELEGARSTEAIAFTMPDGVMIMSAGYDD